MKLRLILFLAALFSGCAKAPSPAETTPPVNGVWIAAPRHNTMLHTRKNIDQQLEKLASLGVNTLFVCAWADNQTAFQSETLLRHSNYNTIEETWMFKDYVESGVSFDPLSYLIDRAHERQMKVIFWFEYGFMAQWGKEPDARNHPVLAAHPSWKGLGADGKGTNYNQTDFYYNAYHPEVQQFLLDLIAESLELYPEVDGIQGDDRLPASPANSGYDPTTIQLYRAAHQGSDPPQDFRDEEWFRWRVNLLNDFAGRLHALVKGKKRAYVVASSPNPYPWCLENLMQDWPTWIKAGHVDLLNVQCYRTNFPAYRNAVDDSWQHAEGALGKDRFAPGLILGIASQKMIAPASLDSMLLYNRKQGYGGQSFFYVKWMAEDSAYDETIRKYQQAR